MTDDEIIEEFKAVLARARRKGGGCIYYAKSLADAPKPMHTMTCGGAMHLRLDELFFVLATMAAAYEEECLKINPEGAQALATVCEPLYRAMDMIAERDQKEEIASN